MKLACFLSLGVLLCAGAAQAAATKPTAPAPSGPSLLPGGNSKEPVSIEADKLVYFDKEQKAIYSGSVVVIQGDTKLTCSIMTIYMEKTSSTPTNAATPAPTPSPAAPKAADSSSSASSGTDSSSSDSSRIKHMDCTGPVTVLSKTQTATGDNGSYDKSQNKVYLNGHVTLSDGGNVTKGEKLVYDLTTGQATVETSNVSKERVKGQFLPNNGDSNSPSKPKTSN